MRILDERGRLVPPKTFQDAVRDQKVILDSLRVMEGHLADANRRLRFSSDIAYESWRESVRVAQRRHEGALAQLREWMEADREVLLRRCWKALGDIELETEGEEQLMDDLDAHFGVVEEERKTA